MLPEAGATELIFLAAVALIVVGPKDLPVLMRKAGQWIAKMRGLAAEFRSSFDELARQSELDELRKEVEALRTGRDPLTSIQPTLDEVSAGLDPFEASSVGSSDPHGEYPAVGPGFNVEPAEAPAALKPKRAPRKKAAAPEGAIEAEPAPKPRRTAAAKPKAEAAAQVAKAPAKPRAKRAARAETEA